jgi:aminopeptidase-like protein
MDAGVASAATDRGAQLFALVEELYPICRSITGNGTRATLEMLERYVTLQRTEVPTGRKVFDWEIPREWNIRDAYIKNAAGERIVDFKRHNLHVVNYSTPVSARMTLGELRPHLFSLPQQPDWIPYRTSYYKDSWGFCLPHRQLESLPDGEYEVCIDSTLTNGSLTYAEAFMPGESSDEVLIYTHICHPSTCNDNLSAIAVATFLAQSIGARARRLSYRFVFAPTTIGGVTWLALNEPRVGRIRHGLVLASLGDRGQFVYKRSRRGNADVDRIVEYVLEQTSAGVAEDFSPYGYDERQFCSPGFNLPVGRLTRTPNGRYPEYHTSADDLSFITAASLDGALRICERVCELAEANVAYVNLSPKCEPRLGPRGLFNRGMPGNPTEFEHAILWILNQSDGTNDLLDIALKSKIGFSVLTAAANALCEAKLITPAPGT